MKPNWTLEPDDDEPGCWKLYKHDRYERGSVLEGQERRSLEGFFKTVEEAKAKNPLIRIEVLEHTTRVEHTMQDCPPRWFSPLDAGESW